MNSIRVGIYTRKEIRAVFHGEYKHGEEVISGEKAICEAGWYVPLSEDCNFSLMDVTIGIDFHWERNETQTFKGSLEVMRAKNGELTAVNVLDIEDYLQSVISSEMSATSHMELLKAHAVISRSWALCKIQRSLQGSAFACQESEGKRICWYGSEPHEGFDVCADDHCQRYQGLRAKDHKNAIKAVNETQGEVLCQLGVRSEELGVKEYEICDARFYKCCGGVTEQFETCWEDTHFDYLVKVEDFPKERRVETSLMKCEALNKGERRNDLTTEEDARKWIMSNPDAFCNTSDKKILSQVLNDYDQETIDFYRWKVSYTAQALSQLIRKKSGIDFGEILALEPLKRGVSGRIYELKIVGSKKTLIVGKELEIRKWLSESHLYSSAFVVEKENDTFTLYGAGWGHGVGLCQIGAAVMAEKGYTYQEILAHYYKGAKILKE
jgi:SpoIID/LytB domain protein